MRFQDFNPRVGITSNLTSQSDRQVTPFTLFPQLPNPRLSQNTITDDQASFFFPSNNFSEVLSAVEDDDLEESAIPEFAEGQLKQSPTGIARLFQLLGNIPTPFNLARRGLESLRGFNDRIRQSDFGRSKNLMDYLDIKSYGGYDEREDARAATMAQARDIQKKIDRGDYGTRDTSIDRGRGQTPSRTTSAPKRSFSNHIQMQKLHLDQVDNGQNNFIYT